MPRFGPVERETFLAALADGGSRSDAAVAAGVSIAAVRYAIRTDDEFKHLVNDAEAAKVEAVEAALFRKAVQGNVEAQKFYLTNRAREEWANRHAVEHSGSGGGPIAIAAAATIALQNVLTEPATRLAAIDYIDAELVPATPELNAGQRTGT